MADLTQAMEACSRDRHVQAPMLALRTSPQIHLRIPINAQGRQRAYLQLGVQRAVPGAAAASQAPPRAD